MSMKITTFAVREPDGDGDRGTELSVEVVNSTASEIRLITTRCLFRNRDGAVCASGDSEREVRLAPQERVNLRPDVPWLNAQFFGRGSTPIRLEMTAVLHSRKVLRLGEAPVPESAGASVMLTGTIATESLAPDIRLVAARGKTDDDGDTQVQLRCGVANKGTKHLRKVVLQSDLLDEDGTTAASDTSEVSVEAGMTALIETGHYAKAGALRGARLKAALLVFEPVGMLNAEAVAPPPAVPRESA